MTKLNLETLSERERACLAHLDEGKRVGVSFSRYCRDKELSMPQWKWKRVLVRKGVIKARRWSRRKKSAGFASVRLVRAPVTPTTTTAATACRIRHPSGWMIE